MHVIRSSLIIILYILENGSIKLDKVKVNKYGKMDRFMKDGGKEEWLTGVDVSFMQMEMCMKGNGKMIKHRARAYILMVMGLSTRACGKVINSMGLAKKYGQMVLNIKEIMYKEKNTELVNSNGLMDRFIKEIFSTIIFMVKEHINGAMGGNMKDSGEKTECTIVEYLNGLTEDNILASMLMTKNKVLEFSNGRVEEAIEDTGDKENKMA